MEKDGADNNAGLLGAKRDSISVQSGKDVDPVPDRVAEKQGDNGDGQTIDGCSEQRIGVDSGYQEIGRRLKGSVDPGCQQVRDVQGRDGDIFGEEASLSYAEIDVEDAVCEGVAPTISVRIYFSTGRQAISRSWFRTAFNLLGLITSVSHGTHATVSVEFHDKVAHRGFHFMDNSHYSMACLGLSGTLFAAVAKDGNPSTVFYKTYDSWATKSEWQVYLPDGENVTAIALNAESAIVATSRGYVRIFSQSGIQRALFSVGSVIAAAGKDDLVILIYHQGEPFQGSPLNGISTLRNNQSGPPITIPGFGGDPRDTGGFGGVD
ncbi:MAG: hypothetical protein J3Q66DRAFT_368629 [Benniella sp.]|nr:MAG: hypothetical protein J3Q66DRAFT_368629 [Benniella sp.]